MDREQAERVLERYRTSPGRDDGSKPFGWHVVQLKARIERRLRDRGLSQVEAYMRTQRIYERIMRYKPTFADYCEARRVLHPVRAAVVGFTADQLRHMCDVWADANDPLSRECAAVAAGLLTTGQF